MKELFEGSTVCARDVDEEILKRFRIQPRDVDVEIVQSCITMLRFEDFDRFHVATSLASQRTMHIDAFNPHQDATFDRIKAWPLLSFAVRYWSHFDSIAHEACVVPALANFFQ